MSSEVVVIWDYLYAWIPEGYDITTLKANIEAALKKHNPDFVIQKKLIAIGFASGDEYQEIMKVPGDIDFSPVPEEYMPCATQGPNCCDSEFVPCLSDRRERIRRRTAKTMMHVGHETFKKVLGENKNILIITGDSDIAGTINVFSKKGTYMMFARPEISDEGCDYGVRANVTWLWDSEDPQQATMVMGGAPIPPRYTFKG